MIITEYSHCCRWPQGSEMLQHVYVQIAIKIEELFRYYELSQCYIILLLYNYPIALTGRDANSEPLLWALAGYSHFITD